VVAGNHAGRDRGEDECGESLLAVDDLEMAQLVALRTVPAGRSQESALTCIGGFLIPTWPGCGHRHANPLNAVHAVLGRH
jgi:hypothetical protein